MKPNEGSVWIKSSAGAAHAPFHCFIVRIEMVSVDEYQIFRFARYIRANVMHETGAPLVAHMLEERLKRGTPYRGRRIDITMYQEELGVLWKLREGDAETARFCCSMMLASAFPHPSHDETSVQLPPITKAALDEVRKGTADDPLLTTQELEYFAAAERYAKEVAASKAASGGGAWSGRLRPRK